MEARVAGALEVQHRVGDVGGVGGSVERQLCWAVPQAHGHEREALVAGVDLLYVGDGAGRRVDCHDVHPAPVQL